MNSIEENKKKSLRQILIDLLTKYKLVPIGLLRQKAKDFGYIESNAERQLRLLRQQGMAEAIRNKKGYITAYKRVIEPVQEQLFSNSNTEGESVKPSVIILGESTAPKNITNPILIKDKINQILK